MAAFASRLGAVIGQLRVAPETNEITAALALLKSLRLNPILLTDEGVRVRAGFLIDVLVPNEAIGVVCAPRDADEVKAKTTLNAAIFSWPEIVLDLREPMAVPGLFGKTRMVDKVAFKLDEPAGFHALMEKRLSA